MLSKYIFVYKLISLKKMKIMSLATMVNNYIIYNYGPRKR